MAPTCRSGPVMARTDPRSQRSEGDGPSHDGDDQPRAGPAALQRRDDRCRRPESARRRRGRPAYRARGPAGAEPTAIKSAEVLVTVNFENAPQGIRTRVDRRGRSDFRLGRLRHGGPGHDMSWSDQLLPASFRGVPFGVLGSRSRFGRRLAVHEYPYRDRPGPRTWAGPPGGSASPDSWSRTTSSMAVAR